MAYKSAISSTLLLIMTTSVFCERWARQIPNEGFSGSSANDWIPVPSPTFKSTDRQQGARVLNFAQTAQASNQQHQFIQNVIPHQKHWQHPKTTFNEEPMRLVSQGFLVPPPNQQQFGFVNQYPQFAYQHDNQQQYFHRVPIPQVNNLQYEYVQQPQIGQQVQQSGSQPLAEQLIMQKPQVFDKNEIQTHVNQLPQQHPQQPEEVQLLYVPLDTLYQQKQQQGNEANRNLIPPPNVNPHQINNFYTASPVVSSTPASSNSIPSYRATESPSLYERTKIKSNQPPLSMFMKNKVRNSEISIGDVLSALKNAKNIDVLDSASKKSPKVFVGPSGLKTPEGYTKFELPYLSTIEQDRPNRQINNLPFFVAPLSYHAPNGFAKIPLPSPHVGSVVVNTPDNAVESAINSETGFSQRHPSFYQPTDFQTQQFYEQNFNFFNPTTSSIISTPKTISTTTTTTRPPTAVPTSRSTTQRQTTPRPIQTHTTRKPNLGFRFGSNVFPSTSELYQSAYEQTENPSQSFGNDYNQAPVSSTTERNFEYYNRDQDFYNRPSISSSTQSPFDFFNKNNNFGSSVAHMSSTIEPTFEKNNRGQPIDNTRTKDYEFPKYSNLEAYKSFKPVPTGHVTNEEYFNIDNKDSVKTFPINQQPEQYNENTSQAPFLPSNLPNEYTNFRSKYTTNEKPNISTDKKVEEAYQTQTAKPIEYSTKAQEILKMKSHFREQNSQYTRPNLPSNEGATQQTFSYTPVTISYDNLLKPLSSTANYDFFGNFKNSDESSADTVPPKISYFTPTPNYDEDRPEKSKVEEPVKYFKYSIIDQKNTAPEIETSNEGIEKATVEPLSVSNPSIGNKYWESNSQYNQFNGPSTLRPVQSLPGLINGLMDEESEKSVSSTTETVNIPRRTPTRRRRPDTTQSPSTSTTENSARRTTFRGRRPIHYANRTTTVRTTIARNTSRVRYNPTPEERQQLRGQNSNKKESENLEYQRDVLKQNYPVVSRNPSTEAPVIENFSTSYPLEAEVQKTNSENEYTVVNEREDVKEREDETTVVPVTTLRPTDTNQRSNFRQTVRKVQRYGTTTTVSPSSASTQAQERLSRDRYTVRPRSRYETTTQQARTTKKRTDLRQRRPTTTRAPATSTNSGKDDKSNNDSYQQISRFNTDFYQESTPATVNYRGDNQQKNHRYTGSHFGLKSEETRWSVKSNQSSFQPIDPEANIEDDTIEENEPMIVTAQSFSDQDLESFNIPVKQSFDFSPVPKDDKSKNTEPSNQDSSMETLFEDLVNEIVTDSKKNELIPETENAENLPANHKTSFAESNAEKKAQRRGVWKRIRVRPIDAFETAESQNYGQQYINHIPNVDVKEEKSEKIKHFDLGITSTMEVMTSKNDIETTTPLVELEPQTEVSVVSENDSASTSTTTELEITSTTEAATEAPIEITTTIIPEDHSNILNTVQTIESHLDDTTKHAHDQNDAQVTEYYTETPYYDDYDTERIFTETQHENREDDQEPQSSDIFSEVKQRLTDLFAVNNDYDDQENSLPLRMQQYTKIDRNKSLNKISDDENDKKLTKPLEAVTTEATSSFHKNLMDSVIYATSTSTEVSHETEICYRGRCIKTDKKLKT